ncbi:MAG TPA: hypothetical protein VML54_12535 [Candidatus Limnocylindrales bacterium]|nr:hypothetical protein [Candidatus Limnocylindrales bacterium]
MARSRRTAIVSAVAALLFLLGAGSIASAGRLSVSLVQMSTVVAPGGTAVLEARSAPAAACRIVVQYKSGPSKAQGLGPTTADSAGRVRWSWRVATSTRRGSWPVTVACEKGGDRGELTVRMEVG